MTVGHGQFWAPSYEGGGLLNLMASIGDVCGVDARAVGSGIRYPLLNGIDTSEWRRARNLVLVLADGVGADFIRRHSPNGFFSRNQRSTLTSVCPTTTAVAIPTVMTGLPPAVHGLTGWHVYLEEIDCVTAVLPLTVRGVQMAHGSIIDPAELFTCPSIYSRMQRAAHVLSPSKIAHSPFSQIHTQGATLHPYLPPARSWLDATPFARPKKDFFGTLKRLCQTPGEQTFIYAYWPDFDHAAHESGVDSPTAVALFHEFEAGVESMMAQLRGTDTTLIMTADHGFIDSPSDRQVHLEDHVALAEMLSQPVCGERRLAYCYLKPGAEADFVDYIDSVLSDRMEAWPREKLLDEQWFGPGPVNPRLAGRIGDYVLAMKDNWTLVDHVPGEKPLRLVGVHGGLSQNEMIVPLCVANA